MDDLKRMAAPAAAIAALAFFASPALAQRAETSDLGDRIRTQLQQCWNPPIGGSPTPAVRLRIALKRDGALVDAPEVVNPSSAPGFERAAAAAIRAVRRCAPLELPAERYADWRELVVNFDPAQLP